MKHQALFSSKDLLQYLFGTLRSNRMSQYFGAYTAHYSKMNILFIKVDCTPSCIFCHFYTKGNNFCDFLFATWDQEALQNGVYSQGKEIAPCGADSFPKELTPLEK